MYTADTGAEGLLAGRLDDLELRVASLESIVMEAFADTGIEAPEALADADHQAAAMAGRPIPVSEADPTLHDLQLTAMAPPAEGAFEASAEDEWTTAPVEESFPAGYGDASAAPTRMEPVFDLAYVEERLAGRALALMGGLALILGAIFFLSLAFSRGWIGPDMQVILGLAGGTAALLIGGVLLLRGDRIVGHVLTAVGLAIISVAFFAAVSVYALLLPAVGLAGTLVAAGVATAIAVASRSQIVAGFGLVAVLAAPPILGATADILTLVYLAIVLSGVAVVSLWQTWSWLPPTAFILSAPQVYLWISTEPAVELAFVALLGYWALMAVAAGGETLRRERPELSLSAAPLFMLAGAFVCFLAYSLMPEVPELVAFLLALAFFHAIIVVTLVARRGPVDPFGLLVAAYGIAIASMAVPIAFGASLTAVVWSAEAAALAVVAGRRSHGPSLLAALAFLALATLRIAAIVLEARGNLAEPLASIGPVDALVVSLAFYLLAAIVICVVVPSRAVRLVVVGTAVLACLPVVYWEFSGVPVVAAWTALAVASVTSPRWLSVLPERAMTWQLGPALEWLRPKGPMDIDAALLPTATAALAGTLAVLATASATLGQPGRPDIPFSNSAGISALIVAGGCLLAGFVGVGADQRRRGAIAAGFIIAVAGIFQLPLVWTAVLWALLATVAFRLGRSADAETVSYVWAGTAGLVAVAGAVLLIAPPDRLVVGWGGLPAHPLFVSEATLALGALIIALLAAARTNVRAAWTHGALAAAGIAGLYLVSIGVVDIFAGEAFGPPRASALRSEELTKEAHVALSVVWAAVGVLVTAAGLILKRARLRMAGLAVLGLATAKVFLFDLSSLDIAYRVITLIVLGVLLIASALAWTRLKPMPDHRAEVEAHATTTGGLKQAPTSPPRHGQMPLR